MNKIQKLLYPIFRWLSLKLGYSRESFDYITQYVIKKHVRLIPVQSELWYSDNPPSQDFIKIMLSHKIADVLPIMIGKMESPPNEPTIAGFMKKGVRYRAQIVIAVIEHDNPTMSFFSHDGVQNIDQKETEKLCQILDSKKP